MQLSLQTFQQLLQRSSAAVQSSASQLIDLSVGSILRAVLEANASIGLWVQWLIFQTLGMTRAATSNGADLDSWMSDFHLTRLTATPARGLVTFSRLLTGTAIAIPVGTLVKAASANISFLVIADTANAAWNAALSAYLLPASIATIDLPVAAQSGGADGNVTPGAITVLASAVPGLDFVSNSQAMSGGYDAESDSKFRDRFQAYIDSRSHATPAAVGYAIISLQQSLRYKIFENIDARGTEVPGQFFVIVDDGTGQPSASIISAVYAAIDKVRPVGSGFAVRPPDVVSVNVVITLSPSSAALQADTRARITKAVTTHMDQLPIGATLSITRLIEIAYRVGQFPENISGVSLNNVAADLSCSPYAVLKAQSITVQ